MPQEPDPESKPHSHTTLKALAAEKSGALDAGDSVATAGDRLRENQTGRWPVVEDSKLVGVVKDENPDWKMGGHGHDPNAWKVSQIMSREVFFCYEDEDCSKARQVMEERNLQFLPVVDREMHIVGIFTREEIEQRSQETPGTSIS